MIWGFIANDCKIKLGFRSRDDMPRRNAVAIALTVIVLGYVGAAAFYSPLMGLSVQFPYLCPICPHIISVGSPWGKFIRRTVALGTLNALTMLAFWWAVIKVVAVLRQSGARANE